MAGRLDDPYDENAAIVDHENRLRRLERSPQIGFTSIDEGSLRVASMEGLLVEGSERVTGILIVDGTLQVTGTETVSGTLIVSGGQIVNGTFTSNGTFANTGPMSNTGTFTNSGPLNNTGKLTQTGDADLNGNTRIQGTTTISGNTEISGVTTLKNDLNVASGGQITAGNVTIDPGGTYGGQIVAGGGGVLYLSAGTTTTGGDLTVINDMRVFGNADITGDLVVTGAKSFRIPHPQSSGKWLQHGSTESPVSGVEYWGEAVLDDDGHAIVNLPAYFDALTKPDGRTVFVTGRGFAADWSDVDDQCFTVYGSEGGKFSWLVKAERAGGGFPVESDMTAEDLERLEEAQSSNSGQ